MKINTTELAKKLAQDDSLCIIDVRSPGEFKSVCIPGSKNIPLSDIEKNIDSFKSDTTTYVMCHAGNRSNAACQLLKKKGLTNIVDVQGGIQSWIAESHPVEKSGKATLPIMRQVLLIAGALILIGALGSLYAHPHYIYLSIAVGAGLTFAGASGKCFMSDILTLMPWNK